MIKHSISNFGTTEKGEEVFLISMENHTGFKVNFLTYGCTIKDIFFNGKNVVLGYDNLESYEKGDSYLGAVVGRYANRISGSAFSLDGKEYKLTLNDGKNHLHGVFSKTIFDYEFDGETLVLSHKSPESEENFPGNLELKVLYRITDSNELIIRYLATTDKKTVLNITNHSYFNLNGDCNTILDHTLQLNSDSFTPVSDGLIPTGEIAPVEGTPMDFRIPKKIRTDINSDYSQIVIAGGFDHNYVLKQTQKKLTEFATLKADKTGITMHCFTNQCAVQFYSGNFLSKDPAKQFPKNGALALETQHYPDSVNKPGFPSAELNPGEIYDFTTVYAFSV